MRRGFLSVSALSCCVGLLLTGCGSDAQKAIFGHSLFYESSIDEPGVRDFLTAEQVETSDLQQSSSNRHKGFSRKSYKDSRSERERLAAVLQAKQAAAVRLKEKDKKNRQRQRGSETSHHSLGQEMFSSLVGLVKSSGTTPVQSPKRKGGLLQMPMTGQVIARFGQRSEHGKKNLGIDMIAAADAPVKAVAAGVVLYAGPDKQQRGYLVLIEHANRLVSLYAQLDKLRVKKADKVTTGQIIASAGPYKKNQSALHFELHLNAVAVNPQVYINF